MFNSRVDYIREMLERAGFTARIGTEHLFVSVHDAVTHAIGIHSDVSSLTSTSVHVASCQANLLEQTNLLHDNFPETPTWLLFQCFGTPIWLL